MQRWSCIRQGDGSNVRQALKLHISGSGVWRIVIAFAIFPRQSNRRYSLEVQDTVTQSRSLQLWSGHGPCENLCSDGLSRTLREAPR
jgi:hypothetical protein